MKNQIHLIYKYYLGYRKTKRQTLQPNETVSSTPIAISTVHYRAIVMVHISHITAR